MRIQESNYRVYHKHAHHDERVFFSRKFFDVSINIRVSTNSATPVYIYMHADRYVYVLGEVFTIN